MFRNVGVRRAWRYQRDNRGIAPPGVGEPSRPHTLGPASIPPCAGAVIAIRRVGAKRMSVHYSLVRRSGLGLWAAALAVMAAAAPALAAPLSAYVVMGEEGAPVARAVVQTTDCPSVRVDGRDVAMRVRAAPATLPLRPTQSTPANSKPSQFPVTVCEATLPGRARRASVDGVKLPLPPAVVRRIVVIGDTGCRIKASDKAYQACNDPRQYPFAAIAARAAAWKPDMVIHVGDYLYRENPCRDGDAGCAGTVWGYGWDAWNADFFAPAAPLLAAAPWAAARGNHENCTRAGQGWWRLLDAHALIAGRDCIDPADDLRGDYSPAYAVPLGGGAQAIIFDLAIAGSKPLAETDPLVPQIRETYADIDRLSHDAAFTFAVDHKPVLGLTASEKKGVMTLEPGNLAIQSVFGPLSPAMVPPRVDVLLSGHVHLWQQLSFVGPQPSQFIAGFSGTLEDLVPFPAMLPPDAAPAPGAVVKAFSSWVDGFGYMTLERIDARTWDVGVWNVEGQRVNRCRITGRRSRCEVPQVPAQAVAPR